MFRNNAANFLRCLRKEGFRISILRREGAGCHYEFGRNGYHCGSVFLLTCEE